MKKTSRSKDQSIYTKAHAWFSFPKMADPEGFWKFVYGWSENAIYLY